MKEILKKDYSSIISLTKSRYPENYEIIDFKKFLFLKFSLVDVFIELDKLKLRNELISKYNNDNNCFSEFGTIQDFAFTDLFYYQNEIGICGPKYTPIDEPISVLKLDSKNILWNGYHRALPRIVNGDKFIKGYLLNLID